MTVTALVITGTGGLIVIVKVALPVLFQVAIYLNPFSYMIWVYQDVLWYGAPVHPWAWAVFVVMALGTFSLGYRFFAYLKHGFAEIL